MNKISKKTPPEKISKSKGAVRICEKGHRYTKTSDCPVCPVCEADNKPTDAFLSKFGAPARRALVNKGISNATQLSRFTKKEIMALHGIGPSSLPIMMRMLESEGLSFKSQQP